jgi:hypothetical protein
VVFFGALLLELILLPATARQVIHIIEAHSDTDISLLEAGCPDLLHAILTMMFWDESAPVARLQKRGKVEGISEQFLIANGV